MSFFKKIKKFVKSAAPAIIGSLVLPGVGTALGASIGSLGGAALGSGIGTLAQGGSLKDALLSGGGTYLGGRLGGEFIGGSLGSTISPSNAVGPYFGDIGSSIGDFAGNSIGASLANANLGSAIGGMYGSEIARNTFGSPQDESLASSAPSPFVPSQQAEQQAPASIQGLGSLTSDQQSTNLANQGVYGGGVGGQESDYFLNLINRRLVDESGQTSDMGALKPIEQSYLQKLGLGGYGDTNSLLEAISKWQSPQMA